MEKLVKTDALATQMEQVVPIRFKTVQLIQVMVPHKAGPTAPMGLALKAAIKMAQPAQPPLSKDKWLARANLMHQGPMVAAMPRKAGQELET